jgi:hypothetical protein
MPAREGAPTCTVGSHRGLALIHGGQRMLIAHPKPEATAHVPDAHPRDILLHNFLIPMSISRRALARAADLPPRRINEIVLGKG